METNLLLKSLLKSLLQIFNKIGHFPFPTEFPTYSLLNLWNKDNPAFGNKIIRNFRDKLIRDGFEGHKIIEPFNNVLEINEHLYKCCSNPYNLAVLIDIFFINKYLYIIETHFDKCFDEFSSLLFKNGDFNKISCSHIFNLTSRKETINFPGFDIIKIEPYQIPNITGENPIFKSFLHPDDIGNYFMIFKDNIAIDDKDIGDWLKKQHEAASKIVAILQYIKDEVVHIDYTGLYFTPDWVNKIRRPIIFMSGRPRITRFENMKNYFFDNKGIQRFQKLLPIFQKFRPKIFDEKSNLRQTIERAGIYYETSLREERLDSRFIDLWISMEALYNPADKEQLSKSISENAAFILGRNSREREIIFEQLRTLYDKRNLLVHGAKTNKRQKEVTLNDIELLSSYVRKSLIKFIVLQLRNYKTRDKVHKFIKSAIFDPQKAKELRKKSDLSVFISGVEGIKINFN